jgi:hypothetical protein
VFQSIHLEQDEQRSQELAEKREQMDALQKDNPDIIDNQEEARNEKERID